MGPPDSSDRTAANAARVVFTADSIETGDTVPAAIASTNARACAA
jgi:hypothetical protein